jgi:predicted DNA-binding transcriptional regulator YafY
VTKPGEFATGTRKKPTNEASDSVVRKIWIVMELLRHKRLTLSRYATVHRRDRRSFQRDLQQLRKIGLESGFSISQIKQESYVELIDFDAKIRTLRREGSETERLLGDVVRAMGVPIAAAIGPLANSAESEDERFFHFAVPAIIENEYSNIAAISTELKEAWAAKALVKFRYPDPKAPGGSGERIVEPHRVLLRSGVFYLVGYDRGRRDWRIFALDRFLSTPVRAGSILVPRKIPAEYASNDVLGFMKSGTAQTEVTVELSPQVAPAAVSRRWQAAQRVEKGDGERARIVFSVSDIAEVVRWAFGFGADARIIAPPEAVRMAADMARSIAALHKTDPEP